MRKIRKVYLFVLLSIALILQPASIAWAGNNWAVGNLVGLCAGTEIRVGSGDQYSVHTIVPEDNWTVKVIGGPRIVNGETWWDTSRYAAGDPSGGTGWVRQSQADACQNSGGGGNGGGGGDGGDGGHRDGTLDRPKIADDQQPPLADYFVWPLNVGPDSNDYVKNYYGFRSPLQYQPCTSAVKSGDYYYLPGVEVKPENRLLHPGKDMAIQGKTGGKDAIAYDDLPKVYAVANGKVVTIENNTGGYGTHVIIYHRFMNGDKTEYVWSLYAHLHPDSLRVTEVGQEVKAGDWIGRYDHTGNWGDVAHTHFELRKARSPQYCQTSSTISSYYYDPEAFIQQRLPAPGTLQEQAVKIATASTGKSPVYQQQTVIQPAQKIGPFQFVVTSIQNWMRAVYAFFFPGSTLEISIYRPDGSLYGTYLASSSFVLEIENPEAGSWSYTVRAIEIPQADYPFAVAVSLSDRMLQNTGEELQGDASTSGSGDTTPPVTVVSLSPAAPDGNQNWYKQPVMVTLSATDNAGGDVDTLYSLNNGRTYHLYTTPFTVNTEGINELAYFSIDPMGNSEAFQTLILKIDLTPPVVEAWADQIQYNRLQPYVVHFSGYDPMPGSGLAYLNGIFNGQMVADGQIIDLFWLSLGNYSLTVTGEDVAGWTTQKSVSFELVASIESLQGSVTRLCNENYITKNGVCNELVQKLAAALNAKQRGNVNAAVQILQAFQHAVQAQSGKSIKPEATWLLMMDSNYVIQMLSALY